MYVPSKADLLTDSRRRVSVRDIDRQRRCLRRRWRRRQYIYVSLQHFGAVHDVHARARISPYIYAPTFLHLEI